MADPDLQAAIQASMDTTLVTGPAGHSAGDNIDRIQAQKLANQLNARQHVERSDYDAAMATFRMIDTNQDGTLSWEEIYLSLHDFGWNDKQIEEFFLTVDSDGDGVVTSQEFANSYSRCRHLFSGRQPNRHVKQNLDLWYRCPTCSQLVVNNTGSNVFACPHCRSVIQSAPSKNPLQVQQTTQCKNVQCRQVLLIPQNVQNGSCFVFACSKCGEVMSANEVPSIGTNQTVAAAGNAFDHKYGPTERAINDTLWQAFMSYDLDEDQNLCVGELFEMLRTLNFPQECVEEEFHKADMDQNGKINFEEFCGYYNDLLCRIQKYSTMASPIVPKEKLGEVKSDLEKRQAELEKQQEEAAIKESQMMAELEEMRRKLEEADQSEAEAKSRAAHAESLLEQQLHDKDMNLALIRSQQEALAREALDTRVATERVIEQAEAADQELNRKFCQDQANQKARLEEMLARRKAAGSRQQ